MHHETVLVYIYDLPFKLILDLHSVCNKQDYLSKDCCLRGLTLIDKDQRFTLCKDCCCLIMNSLTDLRFIETPLHFRLLPPQQCDQWRRLEKQW